ncbi:hypothetical protein LTR53_005393 [Teratosphaeriaceae sp. CCFEE 6253]|nr:hypothetical protein LTR53_005393 [Teratosphaeriaceae sp. CCFEE 6253]
MEGADERVLGASLLQWVNTFEVGGKSQRWEDLGNGQVLWRILQEMDPKYFAGDLPEPDVAASGGWTRKWQNLKHVERQTSAYYRDECNGHDSLPAGSVPDLKAIAASGSRRDLEKLIMIIIRAAMASPESNDRMAAKLMGLGREKAMTIATELRSMEEPEEDESEPASRAESADQSEQEETVEHNKANGRAGREAIYGDPMLEREEELLQAQATIDKLQASQAAVHQQMQELRHDKERLQAAFDDYRAEIDSQGHRAASEDFKKLQRQTDNDRAYIDDLEAQMQATRTTLETHEQQIERLRSEGEASQTLRDDLQLLRADNEELAQKLRANENLKKKIQALQEHERANASLKEELKTAHERLADFDRLRHVQAGLEKEIIEKKGLIRNQEYQIDELTTTRKHAQHDARFLAKKLEDARERHDRDYEAIEELRVKLQESHLDGVDAGQTPLDLERKLGEPERDGTPIGAQIDESRHLAEKLAMLEQQLEAADSRLRQASERNAALEEEKRGLEAEVDARQRINERVAEHEGTISELRQQLDAAAAARQKLETREDSRPAGDLAALERENRLMSSAWFDLSGRLQHGGVSLGRRRQEPKSWIGKQRALVRPGTGLYQR